MRAQPILNGEHRTIAILDLETDNDPYALSLMAVGGRTGRQRSTIQRVRSATLLVAKYEHDAAYKPIVEIETWWQTEEDELLVSLGTRMDKLAADDALLVTYWGRRHDLPILRRRTGRYMLFGHQGLTRWCGGNGLHIDLASDIYQPNGTTPSLSEMCAGFGIATPEISPRQHLPLHAQKSQVDCCLTYLAFLYERALARADGTLLRQGWRALNLAVGQRKDLQHLSALDRPATLPRGFEG